MKESEGDRLKYAVCESTLSTADAVPLPQWGRLRNENTAFLAPSKRIHAYVEKQYRRTKLSLHGEGKEEAASPQKGSQPRLAALGSPFQGKGLVWPFPWKEVPRRGGGWMGKAVSPTQSLPRVGKVASGASRIGF